LSDKYFGRSQPVLAWFCQAKAGRLFESLYQDTEAMQYPLTEKMGEPDLLVGRNK
jgi:hypothetical protein